MEEIKRNKKIQQLISTAYTLFMRFGIHRVSIEEICSEAKVSKTTFYKHFKNKNELIEYVLQQTFSEQMNEYRNIMAAAVPFSEKVRKIVELKHEQTNMISREFFNDLMKNDIPEIVELIEKMTSDSLTEVLNDLKAAREHGHLRPNIKPEFILYILSKVNAMAADENLLRLYSSPNELIMELTNFFFYGILSAAENGGM